MNWEYSLVHLTLERNLLQTILADQGRAGWELATIADMGTDKFAVFKRPVDPIARVGSA